MAATHRSQFEQLIDAGLASQQPVPRARAFRAASQTGIERNAAPPAKPHLSARDLRRAYRDWLTVSNNSDPEASPEPQAALPPEPSLSSLLDQLANHRNMTRSQLQALRRQLARRLHPDLVSPDDRLSATAEMAKLNAIIDTALRAHPC